MHHTSTNASECEHIMHIDLGASVDVSSSKWMYYTNATRAQWKYITHIDLGVRVVLPGWKWMCYASATRAQWEYIKHLDLGALWFCLAGSGCTTPAPTHHNAST